VPTALLFRVLGIAKSAERYSIRAIGARDLAGSRGCGAEPLACHSLVIAAADHSAHDACRRRRAARQGV